MTKNLTTSEGAAVKFNPPRFRVLKMGRHWWTKFIGPLIAFWILIAPGSLFADEPPIFDLMTLGHITGSTYLQPDQSNKIGGFGIRGVVGWEGAFMDDYGMKISLDYYTNLAGLDDTISSASSFDLNRFSFEATGNDRLKLAVEIKEAWIDMYAGPFDLRLGRQILAWGQADGNNPTDTLNARHMGTRFLSTLDEQKIGTLAANALYFLPDNRGTIQIVYMPLSARADLPSIAMDVTFPGPPPMRMIIEEDRNPESALSNGEIGARGLFYLGSVSISGSFFTYLDRYPDFSYVYTTDIPTSTITTTLTPEHNRVYQLGFDIAWLVNGWDIRSEWAYFKTVDTDGDDPLLKNDSLSGVVQISRSFMDSALTASIAWAPRIVLNYTDLSDYSVSDAQLAAEIRKYDGQAYANENIFTIRLAGKFMNETLQPEVMYLVESAARDWMARFSVSYSISDGLNVKFGGVMYDSYLAQGDTDRELGTFSKASIIDDDYVFAELTYAF